MDSARGLTIPELGLKRPRVASQPTHFTDMETEGQSQETHGQVLTARSSDSAVTCFPRSTLGHKQAYEPPPLGRLTEKDLGRVCCGHSSPSRQTYKLIWPRSCEEGAGIGQGSGACPLEFWTQV